MTQYYVNVDEERRICVTTIKEEWAGPDAFQFDFPDDFDFSKQNDYLIQDGELVYSPSGPSSEQRILELKQKLAETDYVVAKIAESQITGIALNSDDAERYADIITQRQQWRDQINELEESVQNGS